MIMNNYYLKIANRHGNSYSVSPISGPKSEDNIEGGGVHQWYMTFGHQSPISIVKQCFSA